ncbi:phthiotriol/phenolphthiotriol dimycocerosates methyltransferase [Mycolicibacterium celeriflavum]|uniref:phthiotriol/phenolphthiotriol dimycocerosates methyltransferase n=1 Tax=Mycolicibacterium celeriflavum TaxID=1249101 RepID=UPI000E7462D6|nr:class I SAM-dependent methyltransferase [Mycolicibacterium celeriflavum]
MIGRFIEQRAQKVLYRAITRRLGNDDVSFLNYGYEEEPPMDLPLSDADEPDRYFIQLYHRTATQGDLRGKHVLEVSCGHGGGASYLMRTLHPVSYTGLDLNPDGIALCRSRHDLAGLEFVHGNAENLPFPDESFDAVINIEAALHYADFSRFLSEVARVLRPGGRFLYADVRGRDGIAAWEAALATAPLRMLSHRVINADVVRGMEKNSQRWQDLIDLRVPRFLRGYVRTNSGVRGSAIYRAYSSGASSYRMYCFVKA